MNISELMINDFVLLDNRVCKIVATNAYRDCVELIDISDEDNEVVGRYAKYISPIPLTPEILERNGFKKGNSHTLTGADTYFINVDHNGFDYRLSYKFPSHEYFALDSYDDKWYRLFVTEFVPKYVHELQHALRLCRLNDLANNFKVE